MSRVTMTKRVEITQPFIGKTIVDFWNDLSLGDIIEFSRTSIVWDTTILQNLRTGDYAPDNKWRPYLVDENDQRAADDKRALFRPIEGYK